MESQNRQLLKKLQEKKFKDVSYYLSELPDEELKERLYFLMHDVLDEDVNVDQDALRNLLHFFKREILELEMEA